MQFSLKSVWLIDLRSSFMQLTTTLPSRREFWTLSEQLLIIYTLASVIKLSKWVSRKTSPEAFTWCPYTDCWVYSCLAWSLKRLSWTLSSKREWTTLMFRVKTYSSTLWKDSCLILFNSDASSATLCNYSATNRLSFLKSRAKSGFWKEASCRWFHPSSLLSSIATSYLELLFSSFWFAAATSPLLPLIN
jgi:hypothetical protein